MISLIIPATSSNSNYTNNLIRNIRDLYPNEDEVEIVLEINDEVTLGVNYNNAVARAKGEKIILLHNDMVLSKGFIETMDKHISKRVITTYTRIEPPIYMDTYAGKVIKDCGSDLSTFDEKLFNQIQLEESLIGGGSQLFFGCLKEDYIGIDGNTFKMFCEDDDIHLRYKLAGFENKVSSAHVYHFVSKTSRTSNNYQQIELQSNRNFVRKWGSRNPKAKYNIAFVVHNCSLSLLEILEPWCDRLYTDCEQTVIDDYINKEQANTKYDLTKRVLITDHNDAHGENDVVVELDANELNHDLMVLIQQLPEMLIPVEDHGVYEIGKLKVTIHNLTPCEVPMLPLFSKQD